MLLSIYSTSVSDGNGPPEMILSIYSTSVSDGNKPPDNDIINLQHLVMVGCYYQNVYSTSLSETAKPPDNFINLHTSAPELHHLLVMVINLRIMILSIYSTSVNDGFLYLRIMILSSTSVSDGNKPPDNAIILQHLSD